MLSLRIPMLISALLLLLLLFLQYRLWFESGGIRDMVHLRKQLKVQLQLNADLQRQNDLVLFQINRLRQDHGQAEERARNELGMIRKDEKFYQIVK